MPNSQSDQQEALNLLTGGEMRSRIAAFDWSRTSLGPAPDWPQSLKSAVEIMLASRYPMLIWWGPELIQLYNDAYIPVLGLRHPGGLGQPARECWADAWPFVGPLADAVMNRGVSTWSERLEMLFTRRGFPEEVYFTFSYSPIRDDDGAIGGLFCACTEDTPRVLGERRLAALSTLASQTAAATAIEEVCDTTAEILAGMPRDLPFSLLYLLDDDQQTARLAGQTGGASAPLHQRIGDADAGWPFSTVLAQHSLVEIDDLEARLGEAFPGLGPEPSRKAVVLPLGRSGRAGLAGFLVAGISPRLVYDDGYRAFLDLLARQVSTALAAAHAYEQERNRAEALQALDRAKTNFFSNVSHEFRTPLTLIQGPLEDLMARGSSLPADDRENVALAHRNSQRLQKLVNTLLDFSRIEAGRVDVSYEPTELAALTADLASNFRSAAERAGLSLVVTAKPLPEPVFVDRDMWEKIVLNLVSNAFKFTHDGEIEVTVRPSTDGRHAELAVRDSGIGIPAIELPRLFERFHRVEGARGRSFEGSGIGLALVQELVRLQGGTIAVHSKVGSGSVFTVSVPFGTKHLASDRIGSERKLASTVASAEAYVAEAMAWLPDDTAPTTVEATRTGASLRSSARILLADDNADMRAYVERLLTAKGYAVEAVGDGEAALEAARRQMPDLILADIMMPRSDGFEMLAAVRADPNLRETPFVLLSARAGEDARAAGIEAGANDYLTKPFSARELAARVSANLTIERDEREARLRESEEGLAAELRGTELLRELAERLVPETRSRTFYEEILSAAMTISKADAGTIQLYEPETQSLVLFVTQGFDSAMNDHYHRVDADSRTACGMALRTNRRSFIDFEDEADEDCRLHTAAGYRSALATPLLSRQGAPLGMLNTHWHDPHSRPSERELRFLDLLARQAADMIEARHAEEALRESEARLRAVLEQAPLAVAFIGPSGEILFRNPTFDRLWGRPAHLTSAQTYSDVYEGYHLDGRRVASEDWPGGRALKGETVEDDVFEIVNESGVRITCWFAGAPIRNDAGQIVGGVVLFRDISEERRVNEALRTSEERLRQFGEASQDVLWIRDAETLQWTYLTPAFEDIYGVSREEALSGDNYGNWLDLIVPEDRERANANIERVRAGERVTFEFRIKRPRDGEIRWMRNTDFPIYSNDGTVSLIGGIGHDATDLKRSVDRQATLLAELQHRVRNILAVTRSIISRSNDGEQSTEDYVNHLQGRIAALARTQVLLTRTAGTTVDLEDLIRDELLAQVASSNQATLDGPEVTLSPKVAEVLTLALHELATNATKYGAFSTPGGRLKVDWRVEPRAGQDWLLLDWREHGVRIIDAAPRRQGFGSELISRRIPYELKGKGTFEFKPGGVESRIEFPLVSGESILQTDAGGR